MKKYQFSIYKEMLAQFPLETEHDVRKHIFISLLMDTQNLMMSKHGDDYEGNHIDVMYARDILGHKTYLESIKELSGTGILNRQKKYIKEHYFRQLHFYDPMNLTFEKQFTVPSKMRKVNNSIDNLINRKLINFSEEGKIVLNNLQDENFKINCSLAVFETYYTEHYPKYCESKKYQKKKEASGKYRKRRPLPYNEYQKRYVITWNTVQKFLESDRSMAWRFIEDSDSYAYRIYSIVTACPKFLRKHFTYKGEPVTILDLKQSGPTFLAKILNSWMPDNDYFQFILGGGDIYDFLKKKFNKKDKESAKRIFNIWAYGDTDTYYNKRLNWIFPEGCEIMNTIKTVNNMPCNPTDKSFKNLSCMVYQEESRVFRMIWDELDKEIGWFLTCHDEIIVPESMAAPAYSIMYDILSKELGNIPFKIG